MKPALEKILVTHDLSFAVKKDVLPYIKTPWHYHPEYELVYIEKGSGTRYIGDHFDKFSDGDIAFLGSHLPHVWRNDEHYYRKKNTKAVIAWVIHFNRDSLGLHFFDLPEMRLIKKTLDLSARGLAIDNKTKAKIIPLMKKMIQEKGYGRVCLLLDILGEIAKQKDKRFFSSEGYLSSVSRVGNDKINRVYEYIGMHFKDELSIDKAASILSMSKTSFCRFFKKSTLKTFSEVVNEIRIGYAKRLIMEHSMNMAQISYECGFGSPAYFNRVFREFENITPLEFSKKQILRSEK